MRKFSIIFSFVVLIVAISTTIIILFNKTHDKDQGAANLQSKVESTPQINIENSKNMLKDEAEAHKVSQPTPKASEPTPRIQRAIDIGKISSLDSHKIGWGVQLHGNGKAPEIPIKTAELFKKYNAHYLGDVKEKKVYFVFSASYEGGYTHKILDALKDNGAKAVFFLVGTYIKDNPDLVKRMISEGHEIGNHSMTHPSLPNVSDEKLNNEIISLDKYVYENFGSQIKYFMPPSGEYSEKVLAAAHEMKYTSIFWSFAYLDYDEKNQKGTEYAYSKVMSNLHNGAIIFLHTVSKDNANAMDRILKDTKSNGYTIGKMDL